MRVFLLGIGMLLCIPLWSRQTPMGQFNSQVQQVPKSTEPFKPPKKQTALLAAIPKKAFTDAEFLQYIKTLQKKFELSPSNKKTIDYIKLHSKFKTAKEFSNAALLAWFGKKQTVAIYYAMKAVSMDTSDMNALNNLCAFLNLSGYPHKAIPALKHGLSKSKDHASMLNNTGQAYYQLGDLSSSSDYLTSCTRVEPYHIEANNTLGHIASASGNSAAATQYYENSLKGGYNTSAAQRLGKLGRNPADAIRRPPPASYPESDDNIGFQCLVIPSNVAENATYEANRMAEHEAWNNAESDYKERANESMQQQGMAIANMIRGGNRPVIATGIMFEKASLIMAKANVEYVETVKRLVVSFDEWKEDWNKRYAAASEHACDGVGDPDRCCRIMKGVLSGYQAEYAQRYNQFCSEMWGNAKGYSNIIHYWMPFFSKQRGILDRDLINARFNLLNTASTLTSGVAGVNYSEICLDYVEREPPTKDVDFKNPECKFSLKIPLAIGDVKIDCEKISISGGEGIVGGVEYNFMKGQCTISAGIGTKISSGILNAEASAQYFVTFDNNLNPLDGGIKYTGNVSGGEVKLGPLQFEAFNSENSVTVSVESGVTATTDLTLLNYNVLHGETNVYSIK